MKTKLSACKARNILQAFSPKPTGRCYTEDNEVDLQYDLQIIIPCYNTEKWIKQCLESILKQEIKYQVLVSIVNDGSTDGTEQIIRDVMVHYEVPVRGGYTLELKTQENRGLSGARNAALRRIQGTYITFLDSDDVLADGAIDRMLDAAFISNAEILQGSWYEFTANSIKTRTGEHIVSEEGALDDNRGVFSGFPWGKLYKYNVMEHFQFPEGFWFEDTPVSFILAALPYRCVAIHDIVYGYRKNPEGISKTAKKKKRSVESYWITEECLEEFGAFGMPYDQRAFEYLLRQSILNEDRLREQPREIRRAAFVLTADLKEKYFPGFQYNSCDMKRIEEALRSSQFVKFELCAQLMALSDRIKKMISRIKCTRSSRLSQK